MSIKNNMPLLEDEGLNFQRKTLAEADAIEARLVDVSALPGSCNFEMSGDLIKIHAAGPDQTLPFVGVSGAPDGDTTKDVWIYRSAETAFVLWNTGVTFLGEGEKPTPEPDFITEQDCTGFDAPSNSTWGDAR